MSALWGGLHDRDVVVGGKIVTKTFQATCRECGWSSDEFSGTPGGEMVQLAARAAASHNDEVHAPVSEGMLF